MAGRAAPKLAFWMHQLIEYLLGLLLLSEGVRAESPAAPVVAGAVVIALAATADGPAAGWRVVPRPVHRVLDAVVAVIFALGAIVLGDQVGALGRLLLGAGAVALVVLLLRSDYRPRAVREPRATPPSGGDRAEAIGRGAGRLVGRGVNAYRHRRPGNPPPGRR
jgi:hypothetical protein